MIPHLRNPERCATGARTWRPWREAWVEAAYGPAGFWTTERPSDHFTTGVGVGPHVARAVGGLVPRGGRTVVDVGAGDGRLLVHLAGLRPDLDLVGVDRRPRPPGLDHRVRWVVDHWDPEHETWSTDGPAAWTAGAAAPLVVAHEWLDDLPVPVVGRSGSGWREVEVDREGRERLGGPVTADDATWLARWWDGHRAVPDQRAEVGRGRDAAWAALVVAALARGGRALAVDYGHRAHDRPVAGSLAAYAGGRARVPVPDGRTNLTAGVAVDALAAAGEAAGATTVLLARQSAVLAGRTEEGTGPSTEETGPPHGLAALVSRSERAALTAPDRWGDLWWLLQGPAPASGLA